MIYYAIAIILRLKNSLFTHFAIAIHKHNTEKNRNRNHEINHRCERSINVMSYLECPISSYRSQSQAGIVCGTKVGLGGFVVETLRAALVILSMLRFAKLLLLLFPSISTLCGSILLPFKWSPILKINLCSFLLSMSSRSTSWKCLCFSGTL